MYDMNSDATINFSDMLVWLNVAGLQNGFATGYLAGDANLDGSVDATDFSILQNALFTLTPGWCHGDVNVSGAVDVADFNQWNMHKFTEATPAASALSTNRRLPRAPLSDDGSQVSSALHFEANHEVPESNLTTVRPRSTAVDYFADGAQRSASDVSQRGNRQLRDLLFSKRIDHSRFHLSRADFAETERIVSEAIKVRDRFAWRSEIIDAVVVDW
jgi:hypothetical protein